jgi:DNA-binding MarR family transcriptional regulator
VTAAEEPNTAVLLFIAYREVEDRVFAALAAAGHDLTRAQFRLVQRIGPDGTRLTELAAAAQVTKQTAGSVVDQLERSGYVHRTPDPRDGRARLVRVGARGQAARPVAEAAVAQVEAEWRAHLGERRWQQLRTALTSLREIADPYR